MESTLVLDQQIDTLKEIILFTSDQMAGQKVKRDIGGFLHNIFPVTVCMCTVRGEQSSNINPQLFNVQN